MSRIGLGIGSTQNFYNSSINWNPGDLGSALVAHYDARVPSSITVATGVSQWDDLSGNSNHMTQGTGTQQPSYASEGVTFDNTDDELVATSAITGSTSNIFYVKTSSDTNNITFYADAGRTSHIAQNGSADTSLYLQFGTPSEFVNGTSKTFTDRNDVRDTLNTGSRLIHAIQGCDLSAWTASFSMGYYNASAFYAEGGTYHEIIVVNGAITTATRQNIEGYLAHKWGTLATLDAGHPYKVNPPGR